MNLSFQRGALSLKWCAVMAALVAFSAMALLISWRSERNLFAESWSRLTQTTPLQALQQAGARAKADAAVPMRKCTIEGKVVYSNVDCGANNSTSREVTLYDTHGIEQPKVPPVATPEGESPGAVQGKMIERIISH